MEDSLLIGIVSVSGDFADNAERDVVVALARTVPGVAEVALTTTMEPWEGLSPREIVDHLVQVAARAQR